MSKEQITAAMIDEAFIAAQEDEWQAAGDKEKAAAEEEAGESIRHGKAPGAA